MKICVFDVETANEQPTSICSIGLYLIDNGQVVDSFYTLIKPIPERFTPFNISIHHITQHDIQEAPTLAELWSKISWYFEDSILVAHNAAFDIGCIEASLKLAGIPCPHAKIADTVILSRKLWPDLENHKLNTCGKALQLDFNHHHAMEDAYVSAMIVMESFKLLNTISLEEVYAHFKWNLGTLLPDGMVRKPKVPKAKYHLKRPEKVDESSYFFQKKVCFTTKLSKPRRVVMQMILNGGGFLMDFVDETTDILIISDDVYQQLQGKLPTSKLKHAVALIKQGCPIEIISESQLQNYPVNI